MSTAPQRPNPFLTALTATCVSGYLVLASSVLAMNHGFDPDAPATKWFETLMIPPGYAVSCCGKADAYPVDVYERLPNGDMLVTVADGSAKQFPDGSRRQPWDESVKITVPKELVNRIEDQANNPTDHGWLFFVPRQSAEHDAPAATEVSVIYCFIPQPKGL